MKAMGLLDKPLSASVREHQHLKDKSRRIAPPTALQMGIRLVPTPAVESVKEPEPVAAKKTKTGRYTDEYKATIVARALKAKETGEESIEDIAEAEGIWSTNIHNWTKAAKAANGAAKPESKEAKSKVNLRTLSKELTEAMDRVSAIKKQMRKLLGDD